MKISLVGRLYPTILKKIVKEQLQPYYNLEEIKDIQTKVSDEYIEILKRFPDIGGNSNFFIQNIYLGAFVVTIYKNTKDRLTLEQFKQLVLNSIDSLEFIKKKASKKDFLSSEFREKMEEVAAWCKEHKEEYPENWQLEVLPKEGNELRFRFTDCGLCHLCNSEGVSEMTSALCQTDYVTYGYAGVDLERPTTLADGDSECLFIVTKKK